MNSNEDVKKQLEVKNKEIYLNKLNLDLDNNLEVLVLTIDNLLNSVTDESVKKILEIKESFISKDSILENIEKFIDLYRENLMSLLSDKKKYIQDSFVLNENLEICKINLNDNYFSIKDELDNFSSNNIKWLEENLKGQVDDDFKLKRLIDYLNNIFLVNLNNKILDVIKNRDVILINTLEETYLKYLELNKNTVGV